MTEEYILQKTESGSLYDKQNTSRHRNAINV